MPYDASDSGRGSSSQSTRLLRGLSALVLAVGSTLAGLMLLEVGLRLLEGPQALLHWQNLVLRSRIDATTAQAAGMTVSHTHDATLGFVNTPGWTSPRVRFDAHGFRLMPLLPADAVRDPPILATGDSYTKGDEVSDFDSWPAGLQQIVRRRTINAGVGAYGLDQTVLLTERLARELKPGILVVGFIADDVRRSEMRRMWGREKPYFELSGGQLTLRNVPVPPPPDPADTLSPLQAIFGWSVLADTVLDRLRLRNAWHQDNERALSSGAGERLACPLMRRIAALGVPTLVVAQYLPTAWEIPEQGVEERRVTRLVLDCAERAGLAALDVWPLFDAAVGAGGRAAVYVDWHPNQRGYRITAEAIAAELERRRMLP